MRARWCNGINGRAVAAGQQVLPSLALLDELARLTGTTRQMVFNLPYLQLLTKRAATATCYWANPLPAAAAARFYAQPPTSGFDPSTQLQWLIDTPERLQQYRDLARAQKIPMRVNLEIDVGLHREGGRRSHAAHHDPAAAGRTLAALVGPDGYDPTPKKFPTCPACARPPATTSRPSTNA